MNQGTKRRRGQSSVYTYDFRHPRLMSKETVKILRSIHESFAGDLGIALSSRLRTIARIDIHSILQMPYDEYLKTVSTPGFLYILRIEEIERSGIFEIAPEMVEACVDRMFGGQGEVSATQKNTRAVIGQNVMRKIVTAGMSSLSDAWRQAIDLTFTLTGLEDTPEFAATAAPTESMIVVAFEMTMQTQTCVFRICYPQFVMTRYFNSRHESNEQNRAILERGVQETRIPVVVELGRTDITLRDIAELQTGDIVPLKKGPGTPLDILIKGVKKLEGLPGTLHGRKVVRVLSPDASEEGDDS